MWKNSLWSSWPIQASKPNYERFHNFQNGGSLERVVWQVACLFRWLMMCKGTVISSIIIIILIWEGSPTNFVRYHWFSLIIIDYHWLSWLSLIFFDYHWLSSNITDQNVLSLVFLIIDYIWKSEKFQFFTKWQLEFKRF